MTRHLLGLLVAGLPAVALAEPVGAVLSQPSPESPRLTLSHWPSDGWVVQQFNNLVEIRFPNTELAIVPEADLSEGIEGWLSGVDQETDGKDSFLRLTLACECTVAVQGDGQSALQIDLVGSRAAASHGVANLGPAPERAPRPPIKPVTLAAADTSQGEVAPTGEINAEQAREHLLEQLLKAAEAGIVDLQESDPEVAETQDATAIAETGADLASEDAQASAAADAGQSTGPAAPRTVASLSKGATGESQQGAVNDQDGAPSANLAGHPEPTHDTAPELAAACFENDVFSYPESLDAIAFSNKLSALRAQLVGEFDRPDEKTATALAKLYLGVGLAHEARAVLSSFVGHEGQETPDARLQSDIAGLLIDGTLPENSSLRRADCLGDQALWRGFAKALAGDTQGAVEDEILSGRSLDRLPLYLRQLIAAEIGLSAAENGDWENVRRLEAMARRTAKSAEVSLGPTLMLSARLAAWNDDPSQVTAFLKQAQAPKLTSSAEATLETARRWLRLQEPAGLDVDALRRDLGTLARHERGTALGAEAFELEARLLGNAAGREDIVKLLAHGVSAGLLPEDDQADLITELVAAPTSIDGREPLALTYLRDPDRFDAALEQASFRRSLARSLAEIGAPSLAKPILEADDLQDSSTALALAESFLDAGQVQDAFDTTSALESGHEKHLAEAAAMLATGQLARASAQLLDTTDMDPKHPKRVGLLKKLRSAAIAQDKTDLALGAANALLAAEPTTSAAQHAALLALELGEDRIPEEAARVLQADAPEALAALELLFRPVLPDDAGPNSETVSGYLADLDAEMEVIMEFLQDG